LDECPLLEECPEPLEWEGALGLLGALCSGSFLCCPSNATGIAIISRSIPDFSSIFSNFEMRFIVASWPLDTCALASTTVCNLILNSLLLVCGSKENSVTVH
jgi:hypothetical protein